MRLPCDLCDMTFSSSQGVSNHLLGGAHGAMFCSCDTPDVDEIDQCRICFKAHRASVNTRYGWT